MRSNNLEWLVVLGVATSPMLAHAEGNPKNGLSDYAFKQNTLLLNATALDTLTHNTIAAALADPYIKVQLHDPNARAVMSELARCALPTGARFSYVDPFDATVTDFTGELGICQGDSGGDWQTRAPSQRCKELVSGCMLARVNVLQKSVPISIRPQTITSAPARLVPTETTYEEQTAVKDPAVGDLIWSFMTIPDVCVPGGDCGWRPVYTGVCSGSGHVALKCSDPTRCNVGLRVCDGLEGCNSNPMPGWIDATKEIPATGLLSTGVIFSCPASGTFSVMSFGGIPASPLVKTTAPSPAATNVSYPATESQVFTTREGAFYGDLFKTITVTDAPLWTCEVPAAPQPPPAQTPAGAPYPVSPYCHGTGMSTQVIPYQHAYACYAAGMADSTTGNASGLAYAASRMCASPGNADCFRHPVQRCWINGSTAGVCQWDATRGVFHDCAATDGTGQILSAVTTYLYVPCTGLINPSNPGGSCVNGFAPRVVPSSDDPAESDEPATSDDATGGCSAMSSSSSFVSAILLGLAFVRLRARRALALGRRSGDQSRRIM